MEQLCKTHQLLAEQDRLVRVPFLIKGRLVVPPALSRAQVEAAFALQDADCRYLKLLQAQVIRQPVIDRRTMQYTGEDLYLVMPEIQPYSLVETDFDALVDGPYRLSVEEVVQYLVAVASAWKASGEVIARVREMTRLTSDQPDLFIDGAFIGLQAGFDPGAARQMIDRELSFWGFPGSQLLDGWVKVDAGAVPGWAAWLAQPGASGRMQALPVQLRALPTRQLHITAGNAPEVPVISALRAILTKSAVVIKSPADCILSGALMALAAAEAVPDHPLTRHLSVVYWHGGDESVERILFSPGAFDRVVVWGAPEAVNSVQSRALFTRVIALNPRYGLSLIGRQAFSADLQPVAWQAALDSMIYNQKACNAALVHYVEGSPEQALQYARCLQEALAGWDESAPQFIPPAVRGLLKRLQRGKYARSTWLVNERHGAFSSGVVLMDDEFDILDHPMCRLVVVRRLDDLRGALRYLHPGVSTVGIFPEEQRLALQDAIAARGVSSILPLGQCDVHFPGQPHDGMVVLSQLVDWKIGSGPGS